MRRIYTMPAEIQAAKQLLEVNEALLETQVDSCASAVVRHESERFFRKRDGFGLMGS